jgi:hypothetical protein
VEFGGEFWNLNKAKVTIILARSPSVTDDMNIYMGCLFEELAILDFFSLEYGNLR